MGETIHVQVEADQVLDVIEDNSGSRNLVICLFCILLLLALVYVLIRSKFCKECDESSEEDSEEVGYRNWPWRRRMVGESTIRLEYRAPMLEHSRAELAAMTVGMVIHFVLLYVIYKYTKKVCCGTQEHEYVIPRYG